MFWELQTIASYLAPQAIVIVDDIEGHTAFQEWIESVKPSFWCAVREVVKKDLFGVAIFRNARSSCT